MPDFEALIKQQQIKSSPPNERLKIVTPIRGSFKTNQSNILNYVLFGFSGFIAGSSLIIYLYLNNFLELYFNKFNTIF